MNKRPATLIPRDGIGPEIVDAVIQVLAALGQPFSWEAHQAGMAALEASGDLLPARHTLQHPTHRPGSQGPP